VSDPNPAHSEPDRTHMFASQMQSRFQCCTWGVSCEPRHQVHHDAMLANSTPLSRRRRPHSFCDFIRPRRGRREAVEVIVKYEATSFVVAKAPNTPSPVKKIECAASQTVPHT